MKTRVCCRVTGKNQHSFFLLYGGNEYYLFRQAYRRGVHAFFVNGIRLEEAYDYSRAKGNPAIIRTLSKMPAHIKYIEREYGIAVLRRTIKKRRRTREAVKIPA